VLGQLHSFLPCGPCAPTMSCCFCAVPLRGAAGAATASAGVCEEQGARPAAVQGGCGSPGHERAGGAVHADRTQSQVREAVKPLFHCHSVSSMPATVPPYLWPFPCGAVLQAGHVHCIWLGAPVAWCTFSFWCCRGTQLWRISAREGVGAHCD